MQFIYYKETSMEQWIERLYYNLGVLVPKDLDIQIIADKLGIDIIYEKCRPFSDANARAIFLNKRDKEIVSRIVFFHEMCHLLRHSGDQRMMPELFREGQEMEAEQFAMYAAIPFHMIRKLEVPERHDLAIQFFTDHFDVPRTFAEKRLDQINRRIAQGIMDEEISSSRDQIHLSDDVDCLEDSCSFYSYYDFMNDVDGPSQLIVQIGGSILSTLSDFEIPIDGPFERADEEQIGKYKYTLLNISDLKYRDGRLFINLDVLRLKYGRISNRLIIQMKDVKSILDYEFEASIF